MTQTVRLVAPTGIIETRDVPATAAGPSLLQVLIGSEGTYGVITEANMRVHSSPEVQDYRGFLFHKLESGLEALRNLMQEGPCPTIARLSDAEETAGFAALASEHQGLRLLGDKALEMYLAQRGYALDSGSHFLVLGYDGDVEAVKASWKQASVVCRDHGGLALGRAAGDSWKRDRFNQPYLRDILLGAGVMVDTLETATVWSNLVNLYEHVKSAMRAAIRDAGGGPGYVMTHFSHLYEWGASLYVTFLGRMARGQEMEQWWTIKRAATEAVLENGGTLSHHHGVGRDHVQWLEQEVGRVGVTALRGLKRAFDPSGIMNPGVLLE
jgi:alkyldihydroxyacetonephosphate synthase